MEVNPESFVVGYTDLSGKIRLYQKHEWAGVKTMVFDDLESATLAAARLTREYRNATNWQVYRMTLTEVESPAIY